MHTGIRAHMRVHAQSTWPQESVTPAPIPPRGSDSASFPCPQQPGMDTCPAGSSVPPAASHQPRKRSTPSPLFGHDHPSSSHNSLSSTGITTPARSPPRSCTQQLPVGPTWLLDHPGPAAAAAARGASVGGTFPTGHKHRDSTDPQTGVHTPLSQLGCRDCVWGRRPAPSCHPAESSPVPRTGRAVPILPPTEIPSEEQGPLAAPPSPIPRTGGGSRGRQPGQEHPHQLLPPSTNPNIPAALALYRGSPTRLPGAP